MGVWWKSLENEIVQRLSQGWFKAPIEFYTNSESLKVGEVHTKQHIELSLIRRGFQKQSGSRLSQKTFSWWTQEVCQMNMSEKLATDTTYCLAMRGERSNKDLNENLKLIAFNPEARIVQVLSGEPLKTQESIRLAPFLFAQYYGKTPILRQVLNLTDIPLFCSQAVTAIEDQGFLEHRGFNPTSFIRAALSNLASGYYAQGGSTITQQLVKNYFLTPEKTIYRKLKEIIMALILEAKFEKEQILENYLNVIYMGQNGPFEVRGFGAASKHYLNKNLSHLNLSECALLAAILNNPGRYNPFHHPDRAQQRRSKVLKHMLNLKMIDDNQFQQANLISLPKKEHRVSTTPAPYFVEFIYKQLEQLNFLPSFEESGLRVYTSLHLDRQDLAQKKVKETVEALSSRYPKSSENNKNSLQGLIIHVDIESAEVLALVGGKNFSLSQFNRATESRRQVGSVFKPLVYLAALESLSPTGQPYSPLTLIPDIKFTYTYEGQSWSPQNYDKKFYGEVPLYYALKNSLNVATAKLGLDIGLTTIIDLARRLGANSELRPLPSLSLGAFEMTPFEVAKIFTNIARMGNSTNLVTIKSITSLDEKKIYTPPLDNETTVAPENAAKLISMMKQTFLSGTAKSSKKYGFYHTAAGKTGTTSDTKDSWFIGFTPNDLVLTWIGNDDNLPTQLTGASGALPLWLNYMNVIKNRIDQNKDFSWPNGLKHKTINKETLRETLTDPSEEDLIEFELML